MKKFESYLIMVGIRSLEFTHSDEVLFNSIDYFRDCMSKNLSPYKALLFLGMDADESTTPKYYIIESDITKE